MLAVGLQLRHELGSVTEIRCDTYEYFECIPSLRDDEESVYPIA